MGRRFFETLSIVSDRLRTRRLNPLIKRLSSKHYSHHRREGHRCNYTIREPAGQGKAIYTRRQAGKSKTMLQWKGIFRILKLSPEDRRVPILQKQPCSLIKPFLEMLVLYKRST